MKYTARDIANQLAGQAEDVCRLLLPNGRDRNGEWVAGSVDGEQGESLKVRIRGGNAGRWADFATDTDRGDLLDLWVATRRVDLGEALTQASEYLGVSWPKLDHATKAVKLDAPKSAKAVAPESAAMRWLHERGFSDATIKKFRLADSNGAVTFPAFAPDGSIQYLKYRSAQGKKFWSEQGGVPCLFGWQSMPDDVRTVVLCEGETDCVAWGEYGIPALSPTNGAGNAAWIDVEFDRLARFDELFISYDMDEAGQKHIAEIADRLGRERCRVVALPKKDANECLLSGVSTQDMLAAMARARTMDPDELVSAADLEDEVVEYMASGDRDRGIELPFSVVEGLFRIRPGELVILAGVNGSGKTELANQISLHAVRCGHKACIGSFEFKRAKLMSRIQRQAGAVKDISEPYSRAISQWCRDKLWLFVPEGEADTRRLLEVFEYAIRRYGIRWFVVDNLTKCGIDGDDYNAQQRFAETLAAFARDHDATVILCAHQRKGANEDHPTGKMDVKGSGAITDMADSVLVLWKNKDKMKEREKAEAAQYVGAGTEFDESADPDGLLRIEKQRNGEGEPKLRLWYDFKSHQYVVRYGYKPIRYVPWTAANTEVANG